MQKFTNDKGQEPSDPLHENAPLSTPPRVDVTNPSHRQIKAKPRMLQRMGFEGIDVERCQAPCASKTGVYTRCEMTATHVMVENEPRDGRVAGMSMCDVHYKSLMATQAADYAKITKLDK